MKHAILLAVAAASWAQPASACYTGPVPVGFDRSGALTRDGKEAIAWYAKSRGMNGQNRLLVMFYNGTPVRASDRARRVRQHQAVAAFLRAQHVSPSDYSIVTSKQGPPSIVRQLAERRRVGASVELTAGCGG